MRSWAEPKGTVAVLLDISNRPQFDEMTDWKRRNEGEKLFHDVFLVSHRATVGWTYIRILVRPIGGGILSVTDYNWRLDENHGDGLDWLNVRLDFEHGWDEKWMSLGL